tara:strand:+ start:2203 stop:2472 length:270 start_codon:yes stop_codon:yes gene_type:complete
MNYQLDDLVMFVSQRALPLLKYFKIPNPFYPNEIIKRLNYFKKRKDFKSLYLPFSIYNIRNSFHKVKKKISKCVFMYCLKKGNIYGKFT